MRARPLGSPLGSPLGLSAALAVLIAPVITLLAGCPGPGPTEESDASANWPDRWIPGGEDVGTLDDDAAVPTGDDGGMSSDAGVPWDAGPLEPTESVAAPPSTVVRTGSSGLLLRGTVLTPSGPLSPGEVLVVGNTIRCVAVDCSGDPMAADATIIDTHATISPGLIDGHNHATYDFLPEWVAPRLFDSRYQWRGDAAYSAHIQPVANGGTSGTLACPSTKWAELRSIVHGTTTIQGQSPRQLCVDRLARNADHYHGLPSRSNTSFGTIISGPCEGGGSGTTAMNDTWRRGRIAEWVDGSKTRLAVHMAEGIVGMGTTQTNVLREYDCYRGTGTSDANHSLDLLRDGTGTPYGTSYFIHATALTQAQLDDAHAGHAYFIWSPSSNVVLYGNTADIGHLIDIGAVVGIGPDWTVSGEDDVLAEMRFGWGWGQAEGIATLTPERLWQMATRDGARAVDLAADIGTIEVGKRADLVVFGRVSGDPYRAVLDSHAADVRLVLIDGLGYYGDDALEATTAVNGDCESFDACGTAKFLCVANTPGSSDRAAETYEDVRGQLYSILEDGYAGGTAYGRGSELLELVSCP